MFIEAEDEIVRFEVEGPVETIHAAAAALGRTPADYVDDSYAALFMATGTPGDMTFA